MNPKATTMPPTNADVLLQQAITAADIATIERIGLTRHQLAVGNSHRAVSESDPRLGLYVDLVRQRLGVKEDATAESMVRAKVPSSGDIVEHLASRGIARFRLSRPRSWKANRVAIREAEEG